MEIKTLAPICLFTYNRLTETKQTIYALQKNYLSKNSDLFIFSDGPKNEQAVSKVEEVRKYLQSISGFKSISIIESSINKGLANSIISGVSQIINQYGKVIVLEDDLITSPNFLNFMNQALEFYSNKKKIQSINGYSLSIRHKTYDIYFQQRPFSWGWATWADRWDEEIFNKEKIHITINNQNKTLSLFRKKCGTDIPKMLINSINNKNDSWYVRWAFSHFINKTYSVYPTYSLIENIGFSQYGTHCKGINSFYSEPTQSNKTTFNLIPFKIPDNQSTHDFLNYFSYKHKLIVRIKLLASAEGRKKIIEEIKERLKI
jgi:hypothetical protein